MTALRFQLERLAQGLVDIWFMLVPRSRPSPQRLQDCRIISHRGEHDNRRVRENTISAFTATSDDGIWGIEFDLRWTRDLQPVVIHDTDTRRVFGIDVEVAKVDFDELRQQVPEVPSLEEVIRRFGGKTHLMIELKRDRIDATTEKSARLQELLATLTPGIDYHILALEPELFKQVEFAGRSACLAVAELNTQDISAVALSRGLGGVCGHYLLLNRTLVERHHQPGQKLGTGFVASRFCFYRELNRGVDWVFTNHAHKLGKIRRQLLRD